MANEIQLASDRATLVDRLRSSWDGWFNPSRPVPAMAPPGTEPRQWDYPLTVNQLWTPRGIEPVSFRHLRMMADGCYLVRAIIEKMKDRITAKAWHFRLKPKPGEYQSATKERSNKDPRIDQLTQFFAFPDSVHPYTKWARMLLEDRLVIDAASLEIQRNRAGQILNLLPLDGATINVLIDNHGRRPNAPLPAYRQIIHGLPATDFTTSDLVYMPGNIRNHKLYGFSPVEMTLALIVTVIYKTVFHQNFYSESDVPLAYMPMPENMSTAEIVRFMRELEAHMAGNLRERNKIYPVPFGSKIEQIKKEEYNGKFEEWAARVFTFVLGETATPFIQSNNRATAQQSDDTREESGERPLMLWLKSEMDSIIQRPDLFNAADVEWVYDEEAETDALKQAQVDQINVTIHTRTPNELRARDGLNSLDGGDDFPAPPTPFGAKPGEDPDGDDPKPGQQSGTGAKPPTPPKPSAAVTDDEAAKVVILKKKSVLSY